MLKQLEMAHWMLKDIIKTNDVVVDATMGNGYDTQFLAELGANVYAFDVQEEALNATEKRLDDAGIKNQIFEKNLSKLLTEPSVNLVLSGHEKLSEYVKEPIKAAIFNLGYLPSADKSVITLPATTIEAMEKICVRLEKGGRMAIMIYYGHEGGDIERDAVLDFVSQLPQKDYTATIYRTLNQVNQPPFLIMIEKLESYRHG